MANMISWISHKLEKDKIVVGFSNAVIPLEKLLVYKFTNHTIDFNMNITLNHDMLISFFYRFLKMEKPLSLMVLKLILLLLTKLQVLTHSDFERRPWDTFICALDCEIIQLAKREETELSDLGKALLKKAMEPRGFLLMITQEMRGPEVPMQAQQLEMDTLQKVQKLEVELEQLKLSMSSSKSIEKSWCGKLIIILGIIFCAWLYKTEMYLRQCHM